MKDILNNIKQWNDDNGDYTHRLNYKLNEKSIVFDLGGYEGWFTEEINKKYGAKIYCFEPIIIYYKKLINKFKGFDNVNLFPFAVSNENGKRKIYFNKNESSLTFKSGVEQEIDLITLNNIMKNHQIDFVDLIKINIEGEEYNVVEYMIKEGIMSKFKNIQVQFHKNIDNYEIRYENIRMELEKTHHLTYYYPFIWENWKIN